MAKPKILALAGSLRADSFNKKMVKIAARGAEEAGGEVTYIDLKDYPLPIYDQEIEEQGIPENAIKLKKLFWENQGFLFACPEYNSSMSGVFKNTIDWITRPASKDEVYLSNFIDKVIVLMSASPGELGGLRGLVHVRAMFGNVNSLVLPVQKCIPRADRAFSPDGNLLDVKQQNDVLDLGKRLVNFLSR